MNFLHRSPRTQATLLRMQQTLLSTSSSAPTRPHFDPVKPKSQKPLGSIVIYHNPDCETSRNVLNIISLAGYKPTIVEYIQVGWTKSHLQGLFAAANLTPRTALRATKSPAKELGLLDPAVNDETIMEQMLLHPILVNRPIVCSRMGVKLCRPSEKVLDLLERMPPGPIYKEDGEMIIDMNGDRVIDHDSPEYLQ